jgi:hypothetical protein
MRHISASCKQCALSSGRPCQQLNASQHYVQLLVMIITRCVPHAASLPAVCLIAADLSAPTDVSARAAAELGDNSPAGPHQT